MKPGAGSYTGLLEEPIGLVLVFGPASKPINVGARRFSPFDVQKVSVGDRSGVPIYSRNCASRSVSLPGRLPSQRLFNASSFCSRLGNMKAIIATKLRAHDYHAGSLTFKQGLIISFSRPPLL